MRGLPSVLSDFAGPVRYPGPRALSGARRDLGHAVCRLAVTGAAPDAVCRRCATSTITVSRWVRPSSFSSDTPRHLIRCADGDPSTLLADMAGAQLFDSVDAYRQRSRAVRYRASFKTPTSVGLAAVRGDEGAGPASDAAPLGRAPSQGVPSAVGLAVRAFEVCAHQGGRDAGVDRPVGPPRRWRPAVPAPRWPGRCGTVAAVRDALHGPRPQGQGPADGINVDLRGIGFGGGGDTRW